MKRIIEVGHNVVGPHPELSFVESVVTWLSWLNAPVVVWTVYANGVRSIRDDGDEHKLNSGIAVFVWVLCELVLVLTIVFVSMSKTVEIEVFINWSVVCLNKDRVVKVAKS
jgi:uncharacterized Tic20 family protein